MSEAKQEQKDKLFFTILIDEAGTHAIWLLATALLERRTSYCRVIGEILKNSTKLCCEVEW